MAADDPPPSSDPAADAIAAVDRHPSPPPDGEIIDGRSGDQRSESITNALATAALVHISC